jgi:hypothetical protein
MKPFIHPFFQALAWSSFTFGILGNQANAFVTAPVQATTIPATTQTMPTLISTTATPVAQAGKIAGTYRIENQLQCEYALVPPNGTMPFTVETAANGLPLVTTTATTYPIFARHSSVTKINPNTGTARSTSFISTTINPNTPNQLFSGTSRTSSSNFQIDKSTDTLLITSVTISYNNTNNFPVTQQSISPTTNGRWQTSDSGATINSTDVGAPFILLQTTGSTRIEIICVGNMVGRRISTAY